MYEIFQTLLQNQPWGMIILVVLIGSVAGLLKGCVKEARKFACHRKDSELKRDLVERGLHVDEIERIVRARSAESAETGSKL